jgi:toxin HigB-1
VFVVEVRFENTDLDRLEADPNFNAGLEPGVVKAFRLRMQMIRAAEDERTFYALKSPHFEKLKGDRSHQHSMRMNNRWRLIVELEGEAPNNVVVVVEAVDYH